MLGNTSEPPAPATPPLRPDEAERTEAVVADPGVIIELAANGTGSTNDGSATDKPPGVCDPNDPAACF